jgi:tRNA modification GTPase
MKTDDTITAISTPIGKGAIGIIRISGNDALKIAENILKSDRSISKSESHKAYYGYVVNHDTGEIIDEVMYIVMKSPNTYTREDVIEINTHGGVYVMRSVLDVILSQGARLAEPGEFTFRAFINGRIDLTQAEAVADLIEAESEKGAKIAIKQVIGELKSSLKEIKNKIVDIYSTSEAEIDFVDDNLDLENKEIIIKRLYDISEELHKLVESYQIGRYYKDGIKVGIFGRVNVGKSSLLNVLVGKDRVIVSDEPGTTRDIIEGEMKHNGMSLKIIDTAGLRESNKFVEREGIKRTKLIMEDSDIAVLVIDISDANYTDDLKIYDDLKEKFFGEKKLIIAYNKIDLIKDSNNLKPIIDSKDVANFFISAKEKIGINELKDALTEEIILDNLLNNNDLFIVNVRHYELLKKTYESVLKLIEGYENNVPNEFLAVDFREITEYLGEITGEVTREELLSRIFSKFCIGK